MIIPLPRPTSSANEPGFTVRLEVFEGPLELLLALIERQELDISSVSLVAVTEQFLAHFQKGLAVIGFERSETAGTYLFGEWKQPHEN